MPGESSSVPAVYVQILGGLGNQMFQYAAGRSLAARLGCPLKLDLTAMAAYEKWPYHLDRFRIDVPIAPGHELDRLFPEKSRMKRLVEKRILGLRDASRREGVFRESCLHYIPEFFAQNPPVLLTGYWGSPRYFSSLRDELLEAFTLKNPLSPRGQRILQAMRETNAVSIHVRRGDYVNDSNVNRIHGTCSLDYYRRASSLVRRVQNDARFFIFSDDPEYIRARFDFCPGYRLVEGNFDVPAEDMFLMSRCRHHIIANSTFSWWGAWLNPGPDSIVIAPRRWYSDATLRRTFAYDIYPDDWITMS